MCQTYPIYGQEKNNGYTSWHKLTGGGGGGGGTPLHKPVVQYVLPQRIYFFLHRFGLKADIHFAHFRLESSRVFEGTTGVYERICRCIFR